MIKKYRNALLAAAVASFAVGCGGGDAKDDDPLQSNDLVGDLVGNDPDVTENTVRAIADLIGGLMSQLTDGSSSIFETFDVLSSDTTAVGKVLSAGIEDTPTGVKQPDITASCSGSETTAAEPGRFTLDVLLAPVVDGEIKGTNTPDIDDLIGSMTKDDLAIAVNLNFDKCDEPKHVYDGDDSTLPTEGQEMRLLDGDISVVFDTTKDRGDDSNTDDFLLEGTVSLNNYFVQTDPDVKPDLASGNVYVTLVTDTASTGPFHADLDLDMITNDGKAGGYIDTNINAKGSIDMDKDFNISGYNLEVGGSLISTRPDSKGSYNIATVANIELTGGDGSELNPTAGEFAVFDKGTGYTHYAAVNANGITFDVQKDDDNRESKACTWDEIDNDTCEL